jgi:hypothetical protein
MLIQTGGELGDYLRLGAYASDRALGASDPSAVQWFGSSLDEIESPDARLETDATLVEHFFIDGGYRHYEDAIGRLKAGPLATGQLKWFSERGSAFTKAGNSTERRLGANFVGWRSRLEAACPCAQRLVVVL